MDPNKALLITNLPKYYNSTQLKHAFVYFGNCSASKDLGESFGLVWFHGLLSPMYDLATVAKATHERLMIDGQLCQVFEMQRAYGKILFPRYDNKNRLGWAVDLEKVKRGVEESGARTGMDVRVEITKRAKEIFVKSSCQSKVPPRPSTQPNRLSKPSTQPTAQPTPLFSMQKSRETCKSKLQQLTLEKNNLKVLLDTAYNENEKLSKLLVEQEEALAKSRGEECKCQEKTRKPSAGSNQSGQSRVIFVENRQDKPKRTWMQRLFGVKIEKRVITVRPFMFAQA